jgi:hypothetical protein
MNTSTVKMDLRELELLELNARYLRHEVFQQLVENVKRDGALTSVPFAWLNPETGKYLVLSGNHRVQAAVEAGVFFSDVMVTDDPLTEQQRIAIQLSHNAIAGEDDPAILVQLYEKLEEVDWRAYSGLDDQVLALLEEVTIGSLTEPQLDWQTIEFIFLPEEAERVHEALADALAMVSGDSVYLARWSEYDRFLDGVSETGASHDVRNQATALAALLTVYERHKLDLRDGYLDAEGDPKHSGFVPLSSVLGSDRVPAQVAADLDRAIETMVTRGEVDPEKRWEALRLLLDGADKV